MAGTPPSIPMTEGEPAEQRESYTHGNSGWKDLPGCPQRRAIICDAIEPPELLQLLMEIEV